MKNAFFRHGTVLLVCLGLILLGIAAYAILDGVQTAAAAFTARGDALSVAMPPMPEGEINVNTADKDTLMMLPGVGASIAAEIIKEREANGPFHFPEDLLAVKGIGVKKLEGILPHIRLDAKP
jgi:competence ComEA-like helix-hairpin-helix protein